MSSRTRVSAQLLVNEALAMGLQARLDVTTFPSLQALVRGEVSGAYSQNGPVFFKSCGWAGWDLAAARCVMRSLHLA